MKIKAKVSFSGLITMIPGEERDVPADIAKDLIRAKYAEEVKGKAKPEQEPQN